MGKGKGLYAAQAGNRHYDNIYSDGGVARPSDTTLFSFLKNEYKKQKPRFYDPEGNVAEKVGFYPLDGRKPFIADGSYEPDGELPFQCWDDLAFAVSIMLLKDYRIEGKDTSGQRLEKKLEAVKRKGLPGSKYLALDALICYKHAREGLTRYVSPELTKTLVDACVERAVKEGMNLDDIKKREEKLYGFL